jgi:hypothetical protein
VDEAEGVITRAVAVASDSDDLDPIDEFDEDDDFV